MKNQGQTTIFFSLIISVLFLFTLSALEVGRIYSGKIKVRAVFHSTCSSLMADYHSELFERYHLLFMDPTYGTGSEAVLEEKALDYMECSLNGEEGTENGIYEFHIQDLLLADTEGILDEDMAMLKKQIADYEKSAGLVAHAKDLAAKLEGNDTDINAAATETEQNGVELPVEQTGEADGDMEVTDPRDTLKQMLTPGILAITLPLGTVISKEEFAPGDGPSKEYKEQQETERDSSFQNIGTLVQFLKNDAKDNAVKALKEQGAFADYVSRHFSNGVGQREDSVNKCEVEYILKGKDSDYENMEAVVKEIIWLRLPVNYTYLLSDVEKKSEALTMAAAICTATGTEGLMEVVKYLLLGCWAYGETVCEVRTLLAGERIPYVKTEKSWTTDLKTLGGAAAGTAGEQGLSYEDYLLILLAKKKGRQQNCCYARMLDVIEINIRETDPDFSLKNCVGMVEMQGEVWLNPHFVNGKDMEIYSVYLREAFCY